MDPTGTNCFLQRRVLIKQSMDTLTTLNNEGVVAFSRGDFDEALGYFYEAKRSIAEFLCKVSVLADEPRSTTSTLLELESETFGYDARGMWGRNHELFDEMFYLDSDDILEEGASLAFEYINAVVHYNEATSYHNMYLSSNCHLFWEHARQSYSDCLAMAKPESLLRSRGLGIVYAASLNNLGHLYSLVHDQKGLSEIIARLENLVRGLSVCRALRSRHLAFFENNVQLWKSSGPLGASMA